MQELWTKSRFISHPNDVLTASSATSVGPTMQAPPATIPKMPLMKPVTGTYCSRSATALAYLSVSGQTECGMEVWTQSVEGNWQDPPVLHRERGHGQVAELLVLTKYSHRRNRNAAECSIR